ncbi:hypothetical protein Cantr_05878 [Candida viswanathii]|uniref:Uncharacterized protein n=1 Tax=Candida viswanathii TaxID=5486 RepID=A0A367XTH8_9ASCO|nr:hypothetical protein Cantr_05878 [Candida viswanathii]
MQDIEDLKKEKSELENTIKDTRISWMVKSRTWKKLRNQIQEFESQLSAKEEELKSVQEPRRCCIRKDELTLQLQDISGLETQVTTLNKEITELKELKKSVDEKMKTSQ